MTQDVEEPQRALLSRLQRVEAQRRRLERESERLRREAVAAGVSQARVAALLGVRQPSVSRQLARAVDPDQVAVADAIDGYELGEVNLEQLNQVILTHGGVEAHSEVAQAVLRDAVPASIMTTASTQPSNSLEQQLLSMPPEEVLDVVHQHVLAAVDVLAETGDPARHDLTRADRRLDPHDRQAALTLLRRCHQITS